MYYRNYVSPYIVKVEMDIEQIMMEYDDPFRHKQLLHSGSKEEPTNSANSWGGYLRRPSRPSISSSIMSVMTRRPSRPSNASVVSRRPSTNTINLERPSSSQSPVAAAERLRRNSNVSVASDISFNSNNNQANPANQSNPNTNGKRRNSSGFSPHVQLMHQLMDDDC